MSEQQMTVGEAVDRYGPCALMIEIAELAAARKRIPVGFWDVDGLPEGWRVVVNGTATEREGIPPWNVMVERHGLPVATFDSASGVVMGHVGEAEIVAMLRGAHK